ncbi:Uncharacterized protein BM_BM11009 [Brugia malayi]|uniref:Bm11009 n=1 Tax=Brugia malayi TaxID=6279 RepID=A0A0K0IQA8_BRUMA|nr:Uncharacterized protein BM_BM11009 [Brugia malayi]CDQ00976.1 Bm11009 [Brugia malayi]VIO86698.1 Uncharacterized protein BM_BM11009 [Brugia malayi]
MRVGKEMEMLANVGKLFRSPVEKYDLDSCTCDCKSLLSATLYSIFLLWTQVERQKNYVLEQPSYSGQCRK